MCSTDTQTVSTVKNRHRSRAERYHEGQSSDFGGMLFCRRVADLIIRAVFLYLRTVRVVNWWIATGGLAIEGGALQDSLEPVWRCPSCSRNNWGTYKEPCKYYER